MNDSRLLQESNLASRQPQGATFVIPAITGEGLAQGPYEAARGTVEPMTFRTEGTDNLHLTNLALNVTKQYKFDTKQWPSYIVSIEPLTLIY